MPFSEAPCHTNSRSSISLDNVWGATFYFVAQWTADLKRNQSRDLLKHLLSMMWFPCHGNLFNGRIRASHAALADDLDLSREWVCKLIKKLRDAGWIETYAPRKPNGKYQEITIFRIGGQLKRVLKILLNSKQRSQHHSVNAQSQPIPTKEQVEKNKAQFAQLIADVAKQQDMKKAIRW